MVRISICHFKILFLPFIGLGLSYLIYKMQIILTSLTMPIVRNLIKPGVLSLSMQCLLESSS